MNAEPAPASMTTPDLAHQPMPQLSVARVFAFSIGMIGDRIFRDSPAFLLLLFMTDYLGIEPALAGAAIFIPKTIIIFVDPLVGTLSDRLDTRWGRRRPLMFAGSLLASISLLLLFRVPPLGSQGALAAYMSLMILIGFSGYSLFSVPYLTMASEIAPTPEERRRIMSWRIGFMAIGLSVGGFAGASVQAFGGGLRGYAIMSFVYAGLCLVTTMSTVIGTAGLRTAPIERGVTSLIAQARMIAGNGDYLRLLAVTFTQKIAEGIGYGSFAYFCIYVVHQPLSSIGLVILASMAGQVLTQPLWLAASRKWSPLRLYAAGVLGWCLNLVLWLGMKGLPTFWLIPLGLQAGVALGGFQMVTLALLSNLLAADSQRTGFNQEGVYSGLWLAAEKLAFALGALIVGGFLSVFGFVKSTSGSQAVQSAEALFGIGFVYVGVNIAINIGSIVAMAAYFRGQVRREPR